MNKITVEFLNSEIANVEYLRPVGTLTICVITTKDGFTFTGESACVDPTYFNKRLVKRLPTTRHLIKCGCLMAFGYTRHWGNNL